MEVGAGGDSGAADGAYGVTFADNIPFVDADRVQVHVDRGQALSVVDDDCVAVDVETVGLVTGHHDFAFRRAFDRCSPRDGDVYALMVARYRCAVVGAFHTERAGFSTVTGIA